MEIDVSYDCSCLLLLMVEDVIQAKNYNSQMIMMQNKINAQCRRLEKLMHKFIEWKEWGARKIKRMNETDGGW